MSDSDSLSPISVLSKNTQEKGLIRVRGPNIDATIEPSLHLFGNSSMMTSQRLRDPFSHTSMLRRETSPVSMQSVHLPHNSLQQSFCPGRYTQSSMISAQNARGPSPVESMLSIASNKSMASDIISALKGLKCNKYELRNLKDAFNKFIKGRNRKKIAKRRNLRLFMKGARCRSGGESGEQASDSSLSSDDCRSTRTGITMYSSYRRNLSTFPKYSQRGSDDAQSTRTDLTKFSTRTEFTKTSRPKIMDLKRTMQDKTMFKDCTDNFRQSSFRNFLSLPPRNTYVNTSTLSRTQNCNIQNTNQKDRFLNNVLLPSQRFNKSTAVLPIPEEHGENIVPTKSMVINLMNNKKNNVSNKNFTNMNQNYNCPDGDEDENIFSEVTDLGRSILKYPEKEKRKIRVSSDESPDEFKLTPKTKKAKLSPKKFAEHTSLNKSILKPAYEQTKRQNNFVFAKPTLPLRKSASAKILPKAVNTPAAFKPVDQNKPLPESMSQTVDQALPKEQTTNDYPETIQSYIGDVSMRPSFIKRKLYTQTLDVTEKMNNSIDSSPNASPQTKGFNGLSKEKNKTRKVVTNQSCLSRDVHKEDDNLLDLIHKIVPPDRMNVTTNSTQKIEMLPKTNVANVSHKVPSVQEERWDPTAIISTCNNDQEITDEEMFIVQEDKNAPKKNETRKQSVKKSNVVDNAILAQEINKEEKPKTPHKEKQSQNNNGQTIKSCAHRFWQTDSETDDLESPKQLPSTKINKIDKAAPKAIKENIEIKKSRVAKNIKALLDITGSSDASLEYIGKCAEKVANNKSLRIRAAKVLKENRKDSSKPLKTAELRISISDILAKGNKLEKRQITPSKNLVNRNKTLNKNQGNGNTSKLPDNINNKNENKTMHKESNAVKNSENDKDTHSKTNVKKSCRNKNALINNEPVRRVESKKGQAELNNNVKNIPAAAQDKKSQKKPEQLTEHTTIATTKADDNQVAKPNLNVSKRGRLRKITKPFVSPIVTTKRNSNTKALTNTPNVVTDKVIRTRVLETPKNNTTEQSLNISKRGRPRKINSTLSPSVPKRVKKKQQKVPEPLTNETHSNLNQTKARTPKKQVLPKGPKKVLQKSQTQEAEKAPKCLEEKPENSVPPRTRRSREVSLLHNSNMPINSVNKRATTSHQRKLMNAASNENIDDNTNKTNRQKNHKSFTCCEDSRVSKDNVPKSIKPQTNNVSCTKSNTGNDKFVLPIAPATLALVPDSPAFRSTRQRAEAKANPVAKSVEGNKVSGAFSLGFATATIGIGPRHCAIEESSNKTVIDDDTKTVRSMSSVSYLTRSRRPKFLHVF